MRSNKGQDSIGGLCRLAALLEEATEAALSSHRERLADIRREADNVTKSLMQSVFRDFVTSLGRGETGAAALALYDCILLLPDSGRSCGVSVYCGNITSTAKSADDGRGKAGIKGAASMAEHCTELCRAIRLCCSALRGRGQGDCGLDCYFSAVSALRVDISAGTSWGRAAAGMCRAYAALCTALLGSV